MRILFHLHAYPNEVLAGAETMAHRIAKFLNSKGHEIKVLSGSAKEKINKVDGIEVISWERGQDDSIYWIWSDLVITHLVNTYHCFNQSRRFNKKLVHLIHNSFGCNLLRARVNANYLVYNSQYVKDKLQYPQSSCICIPPVDYREYSDVKSTGEYITLVNLNENKGGAIFSEIAKRLPQYKFLGVKGGYYEQIQDNSIKNIKYIEPQTNIKKVYAKSKIVLMLSEYESYGQVAIESISCGVPVINSSAEGLVSALGEAANTVNRNDIDSIVDLITKLMTDKKYYTERSRVAREKAISLDPIQYLENLNTFLIKVHNIKTWQQ